MIKNFKEIHKPVWELIRKSDEKVIERFKNKLLLLQRLKDLNKIDDNYTYRRNNKWRYSLK